MYRFSINPSDPVSRVSLESKVVEVVSTGSDGQFCLARTERGGVSCITVQSDGSLEESFRTDYDSECRMALSSQPGQYCVSSSGGVSMHYGSELMFTFSAPLGPVAFNPTESYQIFHGSSTEVTVLDMREGGPVSALSVHPAALSLSAYSKSQDYSAVAVNPRRSNELAALSRTHSVVQLFDLRNPRCPVTELALPGREKAPTPFRWFWKHMSFSPDGNELLVSRPLDRSFLVATVSGPGVYSPFQRVALTQNTAPSIGTCWSFSGPKFGLESMFSDGRLMLITPGSPATEPVLTTPGATTPVATTPLAKNRSELVGPFDIELALNDGLRNIKARVTLTRHAQLIVQCVIGACRGIKYCRDHPFAAQSVPGSFFWNQCVLTCGVRQLTGPPQTAFPKHTSVFHIRRRIVEATAQPVKKRSVISYIQQLQECRSDWCTVRLEPVDLVVVSFRPSVPHPVPEEKKIDPALICIPDAMTGGNEEMADVPPLPENPEIFFDSDSDDSAHREDTVFGQRKELVKPKLLFGSLVTGPGDRLVDAQLVESLKTKWPLTVRQSSPLVTFSLPIGDVAMSSSGAQGVSTDSDSLDDSNETQPMPVTQPLPPVPPVPAVAQAKKRRAGF